VTGARPVARPNRRSARTSVLRDALLNAGLLLLVVGVAAAGPRVLEALSAGEWARYHAALAARGLRAAEEARTTGRQAARALDRAAPLPQAAAGARAVLMLGRELQVSDPRAALAAYGPVLEVLDRLESSRWRAAGLGELAAELRRLQQEARSRPAARAAQP